MKANYNLAAPLARLSDCSAGRFLGINPSVSYPYVGEFPYLCGGYIIISTMRKKKKIIIVLLLVVLCFGGACAGVLYYQLFVPPFRLAKTAYVYVDRDDTADSVYHKIVRATRCERMAGFRWLARYKDYAKYVKTGRYAIHPEDNAYQAFSRFLRGYQEPMNLTIGSVRTLDQLARLVGEQLMMDSAEVMKGLNDTVYWQTQNYTPETLPSLFIPDTYQVYWNIGPEEFFKRMQKEHKRFWNAERRAKADSLGMTPVEVSTLASIVEEETNNQAEKPLVAGLYINRLRRGIPLQADPTIKFALKDFTLRRITNAHLTVDSPYNTYQHAGLPPGPIRIPTPAGLDAVLNYARHNYLYMCAKEDFSGTHNFAATYGEHMRNARRYWNALNRRKIFK